MTQEQWLATKVLELQRENDALRSTNDGLRELLKWPTLEIAQLSERIDFLFRLMARVAAPPPIEVSLDEFSMLAGDAS